MGPVADFLEDVISYWQMEYLSFAALIKPIEPMSEMISTFRNYPLYHYILNT